MKRVAHNNTAINTSTGDVVDVTRYNHIELDLLAGTSITEAVKLAKYIIRDSVVYEASVFNFNGVNLLICDVNVDVDKVVEIYNKELDRKYQEYLSSPQGKLSKLKEEETLKYYQQRYDSAVDNLVSAVDDPVSILKWVIEFADVNDHIGVVKQTERVIKILEDAGWKESTHVTKEGCEPADFTNPKIFCEYILGQVIHWLKDRGFFHPGLTIKFSKDCLRLYKEKSNK